MKLFFRKLGQGQPIIILHGLFGNCDNWMTHGRKLSENYAVYLVDQRNHGQSPHSDVFDYDVMADDLMELITDEHLENPILLGHSMGGKTVLNFIQRYPDVAAKIVIVDIGPKFYPSHHDDVISAIHAVGLTPETTRKMAEAQLAEFLRDEGVRLFLLKNLYWKKQDDGTEILAWRMNLPVIEREIENVGKELYPQSPMFLPALFIRGQHSSYILDDDWILIQQYFPNAQLETVPKAGHWVQAENPEGFMTALTQIL